MHEKDAEKVWELIQATFTLSNAEEVAPEPDELSSMQSYKSGNPDYQPTITHEQLLKELES